MTAQADRRSDIGSKILIGLVLGGFGTIVGFFINTLVAQANAGMERANNVGKDMSVLYVKVQALESTAMQYMKNADERYANIQAQLTRLEKRKDI